MLTTPDVVVAYMPLQYVTDLPPLTLTNVTTPRAFNPPQSSDDRLTKNLLNANGTSFMGRYPGVV